MDMQRRDFLKSLGIMATLGLTGAGAGSLIAAKAADAGHENITLKSDVRWGMVIDVRAFFENKDRIPKCIEACHSYHNVPHFAKMEHELKWLWTDHFENVFPNESHQFLPKELEEEPIFALCNHCENPPCVRVCPTKATFKNEKNGVTMMDFHRCIGCRFCMAGCPYGARSFNWVDPRPGIAKINPEFPTRERGVVEKCLFCYQIVAEGPVPGPGQELPEAQQPLCVRQSGGAMVFGNLHDPQSQIRQILGSRKTIQRKPELGTNPSVFYIL